MTPTWTAAHPGHLPAPCPQPRSGSSRLAHRADERPVRHRVRDRTISVCDIRRSCSGDRRRPLHPRHRRLPRRDDANGAIQAGISVIVTASTAESGWIIPILMTVFAIGGTTFGMAEESLAFYASIIAVMIAAATTCSPRPRSCCSAAGIGVLGSTINSCATGSRRVRRCSIRGARRAPRDPRRRDGLIGIVYVVRYADSVSAIQPRPWCARNQDRRCPAPTQGMPPPDAL